MKKVSAIILAAVMVFSCSMTSFAMIKVDGETQRDAQGNLLTDVTVESAEYVSTSAADDKLKVTGNVIETDGTAEDAIYTINGSSVDVIGDVTESGDSRAINADSSTVKVGGEVTEFGSNDAINAMNSTVEVGKSTTEYGRGNAVTANGSNVNVKEIVTENGDGDAIYASGSSNVEVKGSVTEYGAGNAVGANNSTVKVKSITEDERGRAANAIENSTIIIFGDVTESGAGEALYLNQTSTIRVGGNVSGDSEGSAINAKGSSTVIVEGTVTGNIQNDSSNVYIGQLAEGSEIALGTVHYLIGTAEGSVALGNIIVDDKGGILANDGQSFSTIEGVEKEGKTKNYFYTSTSDFSESKTITLKSSDSSKALEVSGLPAEGVVQGTDETGAVTLTLNGDFKGGLQNLILTLKDIIYDIFVNNDGNGSASSNPTQGAQGTFVDLTATANDKYEFDYWEVVSGNVTIDNNKFNIGTEDVVIKAHFKEVAQPNPKKQSSGSTKTLFTGTTGNPVTNGKWTQNADGTWTYATTGKFANTWGYIANPDDANSAAWYYFDRNGNMLTGWQKLYWNGAYRWFYFSPTKDANEGKCQLGGMTPDGYRVDADGAWIEE